jgi:hypothetical protein
LELAGESLAVQTEGGEGAVGVDDVEGDFLLGIGRREGARESAGFEQRNAIEPPGSVNEFLDELGFSGCGRLVFVEEALAVVLVGSAVFGGEDGGGGGQTVAEGVAGGALLPGGGARAGGERRVRAVGASPTLWGWGLGIGIGMGIGFVMEGLR